MKSFVSLMYEGISSRDFLSTRSTTLEILSVGPEQPETIGLMPIGVLCIFLRKYILCVLTLSSSNYPARACASKGLCDRWWCG